MKNIQKFNDAKSLSKKAQQNIKGGRALKPGESCPTGEVLCPDGVFCAPTLAQCRC
jgi:hypothetical protein